MNNFINCINNELIFLLAKWCGIFKNTYWLVNTHILSRHTDTFFCWPTQESKWCVCGHREICGLFYSSKLSSFPSLLHQWWPSVHPPVHPFSPSWHLTAVLTVRPRWNRCGLRFMLWVISYVYVHPNNQFIIRLKAQSDWKAFM